MARKIKEQKPKKEELKAEGPEKEEPKAEKPEEKSDEKGVFCKYCNRYHKKTFDLPPSVEGGGINHDGFDLGGKAEIMFNKLCGQPKVPLFIPLEPGEKVGAVQSPMINGLRVNILKGRYVQIPKQIAEIEMESLNQTAAIPDNLKTVNPLTGKEVNARLDLKDEASQGRLTR